MAFRYDIKSKYKAHRWWNKITIQVRLQEIPSGSSYKNLSKNREKLSLVFGLFCRAILIDLTRTFTSRLKIDAKSANSSKIGSEEWTILGHPQLIECMGICVLSMAHGSERRGSNVYLHVVKKIIQKFFFRINQGTCPWMTFAWIF